MRSSVTIREVEIFRSGLKRWIELERWREKIFDAAGQGNTMGVADAIVAYLSAATEVSDWKDIPWIDVVSAFDEINQLNEIHTDAPILHARSNRMKPAAWEYELRDWYSLLHMLAAAYGWSVEYISEMDIDDAFPLVQEIMTDDQLRREWEYGLSEIAYPYDKLTKKSRFRPLQRPEWMLPTKSTQVVKVMIKQSMMPVGNIIYLGGNPSG